MLESFLIAFGIGALFPLYHVVFFRWFKLGTLGSLVGASLFGILAWYLLRMSLLAEGVTLEQFLGGASSVGFFALGYGQVFSMACRGFSATILVDLEDAGSALSANDLEAGYAGGRGMEWMFSKRIETLNRLGWTEEDEEFLALRSDAARWIGRFGRHYKGTLRMGDGG